MSSLRGLRWSMLIDTSPRPGKSIAATYGTDVGEAVMRDEFNLSLRLLQIQYDSKEDATSLIKLTFENEDLSYFDSQVLMKGAKFHLSFGYEGDLTEAFHAQVVSIKGFNVIEITAEIIEQGFNFVENTTRFVNKSRSDIVKLIAKANNILNAQIHEAPGYGDRLQLNKTDREYLGELAAEVGFVFYTSVESGTLSLYWGPRDLSHRPTKTFTWRGGQGMMKNFNITENCILARPQEYSVSNYNSDTKKVVSGTVGSSNTAKKSSLGSADEISGEASAFSTNFTAGVETGRSGFVKTGVGVKASKNLIKPVETDEEAQAEADGEYQADVEEQIKAKATLVGVTKLKVGDIVEIDGLPTMLAGNYLIQALKHTWSNSGFVTELGLRRDGHTTLPGGSAGQVAGQGAVNKQSPGNPKKLVPVYLVGVETGKAQRAYVPEGSNFAKAVK